MFSSLDPKALGELIVLAGSLSHALYIVHSFTISNDFFETTGPVVTKFHLQSPELLGMQSCSWSHDQHGCYPQK